MKSVEELSAKARRLDATAARSGPTARTGPGRLQRFGCGPMNVGSWQ